MNNKWRGELGASCCPWYWDSLALKTHRPFLVLHLVLSFSFSSAHHNLSPYHCLQSPLPCVDPFWHLPVQGLLLLAESIVVCRALNYVPNSSGYLQSPLPSAEQNPSLVFEPVTVTDPNIICRICYFSIFRAQDFTKSISSCRANPYI